MPAFSEQIAVITGASGSIGQAIALALAAEGATLCLVGRQRERLEAVAKAAGLTAPRVCSYRADLTQDGDLQELTVALQREHRDIDLLMHCAGVLVTGQVESAPVAAFDQQYRTNVRAPYVLTQALLPMLRARQGQIVFLNSSVSGRANIGQYAATKYALKALADSLREEVNRAGVRVLSLYPGRTAGPLQAALHALEGKAYDPERLMQPEDVAQMVMHALRLPRSAEVTDIHLRPMAPPL